MLPLIWRQSGGRCWLRGGLESDCLDFMAIFSMGCGVSLGFLCSCENLGCMGLTIQVNDV